MTVNNKTTIGTLGSIFTVTNGVVGIVAATASVPGSMSAVDKTKLDGITAGAKLGGVTGSTDNAVLRADGTGGATVQSSLMTVNDTGSPNIPTGQTYNINGVAHVHAESEITNLVIDLAAKAPLASPTFTGTPAAPTAVAGTNTTQLATTAFVTTGLALKEGSLPNVSGNAGKYLSNDGTSKIWADFPGISYTSGSNALTLPQSPGIGQVVEMIGDGTAWTITAYTGQTIRMGGTTGTVLSSITAYDCVLLIYIGSNVWNVIPYSGVLELT